MPRWLPWLDPQDFAQEKALAELEGRDPKQAVRAYVRQEHRYYDLIGSTHLPWYLLSERDLACAPLDLPKPVRSAESIERRKAYSREWWRKNGREYRRRRAELAIGGPADSAIGHQTPPAMLANAEISPETPPE